MYCQNIPKEDKESKATWMWRLVLLSYYGMRRSREYISHLINMGCNVLYKLPPCDRTCVVTDCYGCTFLRHKSLGLLSGLLLGPR